MRVPWLEAAVSDAHQALLHDTAAEPARQLLRARGVAEIEWAAHQIGFGTIERPVTGCTETFAKWAPANWFDALLFPLLFPPHGRPIGVQARSLDPSVRSMQPISDKLGQRRYQQFLALPSDIFPMLFGLHQALPTVWETGALVVVEGVFDYFAVRAAGYHGVVALMTAHASRSVKRWFTRYAQRVVALTDADNPGRVGAYHLAGVSPPVVFQPSGYTSPYLRTPSYEVRIPHYSARKDPGEYLEAGDLGSLRAILTKGGVVFPVTPALVV